MQNQASPVGELRHAPSVHTERREYDITRLLQNAIEGKSLDGIEAEYDQEARRRMGARGSKARGTQIPLKLLMQTKSAGTVAPNANVLPLAGVDYFDSLFVQTGDAILPCPLASTLGMLQITSNEEVVRIPRQTGPLEPGWVARDAQFHRSKDAVFNSLDMTPKILSLLTMFERSSIYGTHPQARALLMGQISQVVASELDSAIVKGGITNGPAMGLQSDATTGDNASLATLAADIYKNRAALERYAKCDVNPVSVMAPETIHQLKSIPAWTGATVPLMQGGILDGNVPTVSSVAMDYTSGTQAGEALMGVFNTCVLCLWDSVGVELNGYTEAAWERGAVDARLFLEADFAIRDVNLIRKFSVTTK